MKSSVYGTYRVYAFMHLNRAAMIYYDKNYCLQNGKKSNHKHQNALYSTFTPIPQS